MIKKKKRVVLICFYDKISLSLRALSAKLKQAGHDVYIIYLKDDRVAVIDKLKENPVQYQILWLDQFWGCGQDISLITEKEWELLSSLVAKINPHVVGISSRSVHNNLANHAVRVLRKSVPEATFLAGSYGPTIEPREYLKEFDYVCLGEGDGCIVPFVETDAPKSIPNIAYLENDNLVQNKILPPMILDNLPYPDWQPEKKYLIHDDKIQTGYDIYDRYTYDIFCSRGCPSSCTYCMACQWNTMLKPYGIDFPKIRLRSPKSIIDELIYAKDKFSIKYVRFKDDIFGLSEDWLFELMDLYDKKIGLAFSCLLDERHTTEKKLQRLYKSGLRKSTVGIQSADEHIRRNIFNRQISDDSIVAYAKMLKSFGIQIKYDLIGWNPFETRETLKGGMDFLKRLPKHSDTCVFQLKMFPKSPIFEKFLKEKPSPLSTDEYTYWALLHQMILFSDTMERRAFLLAENTNRDINLVLNIFREQTQQISQKYKIVATTDIEKGCRIMQDRIGLVESEKEGITTAECRKIFGMTARVFIKKGTVLQWNDFFHSYAGVRSRDAGH